MGTDFWNSVSVLVFAASTLAQLPWGQVILVLGLLLFDRQYAAALYCEKNCSLSRMAAETAGGIGVSMCTSVNALKIELHTSTFKSHGYCAHQSNTTQKQCGQSP